MADNVALPAASGTVAADEVVDGTLGTVKVQYVKLMDGTLDGTTKATVGAGGLAVDTELPAAAALADGTSNPTAPLVGAALEGWNGTTWDRLKSDTTNGLDVDVTRVSGTVTVDSELPAAAALADNTSNPTVPAVGGFNMLFDGSTWDRQPGNSASGAFVQGDVAHDAAVAANPLLVGGRASAAAPTDVSADGDAARAWFLRNGAQATVLTAAGALVGGDATNGLDVDVTRVSGTVTVDSELAAAAAMADGFANPTTAPVQAMLTEFNGATWDRVRGDTTNGVDVDVTRVIPGTGATNLGKAEDSAHADGDTGVAILAKRTDSAASSSGTDGDYSTVNVDATGRMWVRPAPVQVRISNTPTISTSPAYTSGDVLGGLQTLSNAARVSGGSGIIQSICVLDKTQAQRAAMDILFFDRSVTVASDNAAVAMSDSDMANCLGIVSIGPYNTAFPGTPLNSFSTLLNVGLPFVLNGTDLFAVAVVRAAPTYVATTDLIFNYTILQD